MLLKHAGAVRSSLWRGVRPQPCQTHPGCKNQMTCLFAHAAPASGAAEHSPTVWGGGGVTAKISSSEGQILHAAKQLSIDSSRRLH